MKNTPKIYFLYVSLFSSSVLNIGGSDLDSIRYEGLDGWY